MSLKKIICEYCGGNSEFRTQEEDTQIFYCGRCGKYTTVNLQEVMSEPRRLLNNIIFKHSGKTIEEFEAENGIF